MATNRRHSVAVIGAGIAGTTVAHALALAGNSVHVFDKARRPGGHLATRRVEWVDRQGNAATTRLDHGALGFAASSTAFQVFADRARRGRGQPAQPPLGRKVTQQGAGFRGNKAALPSKPCVACGLATSWRCRWANNWAEVKFCSDACRRKGAARG